MLVNLCDYKQSVTLIANSGVQFLDFGLTPQESAHHGRFVRKTANGPLLRLDYDLANDRYTLPARPGSQPEVVKPESTQT
ncbi:virulence factor SrfB, partial [Klebsiella pneumoniae]